MRVLPARRQVAGVPHWHAQRLLTHLRGDTVCTWRVLRVPRQYIQTGLLGQAEMADGVDLRCPGL